jgi:hypothetical protein
VLNSAEMIREFSENVVWERNPKFRAHYMKMEAKRLVAEPKAVDKKADEEKVSKRSPDDCEVMRWRT